MERRRKGSGGGDSGAGEKVAEPEKTGRIDALDRALEEFVKEGGPPLSRGDALELLSKANSDAEKIDERHAQDRFDFGERLIVFAARRGHRALGYTELGRCLRERFSLGRTWAYESMRMAKMASRSDLPGLSWTEAELGMKLADALEVATFAALKKKPLPVPSVDGQPVFFPAPPDVLEAALKLLTAATEEDEDEPRAAERAALKRAQAILDDHLARHPALAEARPTVFVHGGTARIKIASIELRAETLAAVTRLFAAIDKALNRG